MLEAGMAEKSCLFDEHFVSPPPHTSSHLYNLRTGQVNRAVLLAVSMHGMLAT